MSLALGTAEPSNAYDQCIDRMLRLLEPEPTPHGPLVTTRRDASVVAAERSLLAFIEQAWSHVEPATPFQSNWHIEGMARHLEAVSRGEIQHLLINIPPGGAKSLIVSVFWPAWEWTTQPGLRYLCASYDQSLSTRDNRRVRDLVQSEWYQARWPHLRLAHDQNQKTRFDTTAGGWRIGTSVGGRGLGEHPDRKIVDDPHNTRQSESDAKRQAAITWFDQMLSTRGVSRGAATVVICQRLHERDLSGHILSGPDAAKWTVLCLPMRYEPGRMAPTPLGWSDPRTQAGELLWPALFPEPVVHALELSLGSYGTAGQLQQRPAPAGGGLFKRGWFELVDGIPTRAEWCRSWDKAGTDQGGDYTTGALMAKVGGLYYIADMIRAQLSSGQRNALIRQTAALDAARFGPAVKIRLEQEPGSGGKESAEISIRELAGYDVHALRATGDKVTRARPFAAQAEAGNIKLLANPAWNRVFLDELAVFPNGQHDDQVDAAAGAFNTLALGFTPHTMPIRGF